AKSRVCSQGNSTNVDAITSVSPTQAAAAEFMSTVSAAGTADCFHDALGAAVRKRLDKMGTSYDKLDVEVGRESTDPIGDDRAAYQTKYTIHTGSSSVDLFTDLEFVRVGRGITAL